jgi:4-oxalocrotonate tautomerase
VSCLSWGSFKRHLLPRITSDIPSSIFVQAQQVSKVDRNRNTSSDGICALETFMPFVSVRITRDGVTPQQKARVIAEITETLERVLNKDPKLTHIVIEEVDTDNWGYAGVTTTEYRKQLAEVKS